MQVKLLNDKARVPTRGSAGAAGYDLYCCEAFSLPHFRPKKVPIGIAIALPPNTYGRVAPRSGLAIHGVDVLAGVVDQDYRGEISVLLISFSGPHEFRAGDRIAQLIVEPFLAPEIRVCNELDSTERGDGGFGSTG